MRQAKARGSVDCKGSYKERLMTESKDNKTLGHSSTGKQMTFEEVAICQIMTQYQKPHSQRAQALLALNEGLSQAQAAEQAGLTEGQVRYWSNKFGKIRLGVFPNALLNEARRVSLGPVRSQETPETVEKQPQSEKEPAREKTELLPQPVETALAIQADLKTDIVPVDENKSKEKKDQKKKKKSKKDKKRKGSKGDKKGKKKNKRKSGEKGKKSQKKKSKKTKTQKKTTTRR